MLTVPGLVKSVLCLIWLLNSCTYTLCMYSGEICKCTAELWDTNNIRTCVTIWTSRTICSRCRMSGSGNTSWNPPSFRWWWLLEHQPALLWFLSGCSSPPASFETSAHNQHCGVLIPLAEVVTAVKPLCRYTNTQDDACKKFWLTFRPST